MNDEYLQHYGILGQKWGLRRYQNPDGSLTDAGRKRYAKDEAVRKAEREAAGSGSLNVKNSSHAARAYKAAKSEAERVRDNPSSDYDKFVKDTVRTKENKVSAFRASKADFKANKTTGQKVANFLLNGPIGAGVYNNMRASGYSVAISEGTVMVSKMLGGPIGSTAAYIITKEGA